MSSLQRGFYLIAVLTAFALSACGLQQVGPNGASGSEDEALELDRQVLALAGGVSDHMQTAYARATVWGTGEVDGSCRTFEVLPIIYDRTTMDTDGPTERSWMWVRVRVFCCDREEIFSTWTGSINLDDADFMLEVYSNHNRLWNASVTKSITVYNADDRSQTMSLDLNLAWAGIWDFRHRAENRFLEREHVYNYELLYDIATVSGDIGLPGVTFDFATQQNVWIGDENRTTITR